MNVLLPLGTVMVILFSAVLIKEYKKEYALLLTLGGGAVVLLFLINLLPEVNAKITDLLSGTSLDASYIKSLLKAVGIAVISGFCENTCKDNNETALGLKAALIGKMALLIIALPYAENILTVCLNLIKENT